MLHICVYIRHVVSHLVMSQISMGHVAHMCAYTSRGVAARHVTHIDGSCCTYVCIYVMQCRSSSCHTYESCRTYVCIYVMRCCSSSCHAYKSCRTNVCIYMSHTRTYECIYVLQSRSSFALAYRRVVLHINKACHTCSYVTHINN